MTQYLQCQFSLNVTETKVPFPPPWISGTSHYFLSHYFSLCPVSLKAENKPALSLHASSALIALFMCSFHTATTFVPSVVYQHHLVQAFNSCPLNPPPPERSCFPRHPATHLGLRVFHVCGLPHEGSLSPCPLPLSCLWRFCVTTHSKFKTASPFTLGPALLLMIPPETVSSPRFLACSLPATPLPSSCTTDTLPLQESVWDRLPVC